jgi:flagellar assembly protein FliH
MAISRKYEFDTVFDAAGDVAFEPVRVKRSFTADEVEQIKAEAFAAGERSTTAIADAQAAHALSEIARSAGQALSALARVAHEHRTPRPTWPSATGRKIADAALARFPEAPVVAALQELARELEASPRLLVRASNELVERLQATLDETAQACGFAGAIVVKGDASLPMAAFVLDWGDGRAAFDPDQAAERVAAALSTALAAEGLHAEPLIPNSEADHG